jgi:uncharacterized membrane protein
MAEKERKSDFRPGDRKLVGAFLLAISGWVLHLNLSYVLMPQSCEDRSKLILHVVTAGCLVLVAIAGVVAWRARAAYIADPGRPLWHERAKWMAELIAALSIGVILVIVAQEIPNVILRSCD